MEGEGEETVGEEEEAHPGEREEMEGEGVQPGY